MAACSATLLPASSKCRCRAFVSLKWNHTHCASCLHSADQHEQAPSLQDRKDQTATLRASFGMHPKSKLGKKSNAWLKELGLKQGFDAEKVDEIFNLFDRDRNGYLDRAEAHEFVKQWCLQLGSKENVNVTRALDLFFDCFDANKDGKITKDELLDFPSETTIPRPTKSPLSSLPTPSSPLFTQTRSPPPPPQIPPLLPFSPPPPLLHSPVAVSSPPSATARLPTSPPPAPASPKCAVSSPTSTNHRMDFLSISHDDDMPPLAPHLFLQHSTLEDSDGEEHKTRESQDSNAGFLHIQAKAEGGTISASELAPTMNRLQSMGGEDLELYLHIKDLQRWLPKVEQALKEDTLEALRRAVKKAEDFNVQREQHQQLKAAYQRLEELQAKAGEKSQGEKTARETQEAALAAWNALTPEEVAKRATTQEQVYREILSTEEKYLASLQLLTKHWLLPLKEPQQATFLNENQIKALQLNLQTLESLHTEICGRLRADPHNAGKVFLEYGEYLAVYKQYLGGYDGLLAVLDQLSHNAHFQKFLGKVTEGFSSSQNGLDLMSYLIMPVQRLPRYVLLLKELTRNTDPSTPAFAELDKAVKKMSAITLSINEAKRHIEAASRVLGVQQRLEGCKVSLLVPHRKLLKEGQIIELQDARRTVISPLSSPRPQVRKPRNVFLFNDILLWSRLGYQFKGLFNLAACDITPDLNNMKCTISMGKISFVIYSQVIDEIESWTHDLLQAQGAARVRQHEQDKHAGVLCLTFVRAENLPIGDVFTRSSDPYVKFFGHNNKELRTRVINQSLNPVWKETFNLPFPVRPKSIDLQIWDQDAIVDDFLCQTTLEVGTGAPADKIITEFRGHDNVPLKNHKTKLHLQFCWRLNSEFSNARESLLDV